MRKKEDIARIYEAALTVFARYGYKKSTVEDVATELDMTKGNIYRYVKDKKDLYYRAVAYALLKWQGLVREAMENEDDPRERFIVMCRKAVEYLARDACLRRILVHDPDIFPLMDRNDPYKKINRASELMIRETIERGVSEGIFRRVDPSRAARALFSIYKMLIIRTHIRPEGKGKEELLEGTLDLIAHGLFFQ